MNENICPECGSVIDDITDQCLNCGYIRFYDSIDVDKSDIEKLDIDEKKDESVSEDIKNEEEKGSVFLELIQLFIQKYVKKLFVKRNAIIAGLVMIVVILFAISIHHERNKEDRYIFKDICFGMKYNDVLKGNSDDYSKDIDYASKDIIYTNSNEKVSGIKGEMSYYFSNDKKELVKVAFRFHNNKDDVEKIKDYVKKHFGVGTKDSDNRYVRYGKNLNYYYTDGNNGDVEEVTVEKK